ncbi:hypothetical protein A0256_12475 [Mucilaginibacter sp. PAMC 26640]|nr:hypothetical protein A0256_12475 [Mucilaginibacter sp. PAMC 26640]
MNFFTIQPAGSWVKQEFGKPMPYSLFGEFWQQHELCVLFSDCNLGKSQLAVQLADSISKAEPIAHFATAPSGQTVLYIDCKLNSAQFAARYTSPEGQMYAFSEHLHRAEFDPCIDVPYKSEHYDEEIFDNIELALDATGATVIIINNLGNMCLGTDKPASTFALMRMLRLLKISRKISILVLVQTPRRNTYNPVTRADLQGNNGLLNLVDSAFAIGESHTKEGFRYLKQIKRSGGPIIYNDQNVVLMHSVRIGGILQFEFQGQEAERQHLRRPGEQERSRMANEVADLSRQGQTQRQIALQMRISPSTVNKLLHLSGINPKINEPGAFDQWPAETWPKGKSTEFDDIPIESLYRTLTEVEQEQKRRERYDPIPRFMKLPNGKAVCLGEVRNKDYQNIDWPRTFPLQKIIMKDEMLSPQDEALLLERASWEQEY